MDCKGRSIKRRIFVKDVQNQDPIKVQPVKRRARKLVAHLKAIYGEGQTAGQFGPEYRALGANDRLWYAERIQVEGYGDVADIDILREKAAAQ
jgi:hypothetical protein